MPTLRYLDDRPIFPEDRLRAEAFTKGLAEGGVKAAQPPNAPKSNGSERRKRQKRKDFRQFEEMLRNARLEREPKAEEERKGRGGSVYYAGTETAELKAWWPWRLPLKLRRRARLTHSLEKSDPDERKWGINKGTEARVNELRMMLRQHHRRPGQPATFTAGEH